MPQYGYHNTQYACSAILKLRLIRLNCKVKGKNLIAQELLIYNYESLLHDIADKHDRRNRVVCLQLIFL